MCDPKEWRVVIGHTSSIGQSEFVPNQQVALDHRSVLDDIARLACEDNGSVTYVATESVCGATERVTDQRVASIAKNG